MSVPSDTLFSDTHSQDDFSKSPEEFRFLIFCLFALSVYLIIRSWYFPADVFPDVMYTSFAIRKLPYSEAAFPNYLYYWVYGIISFFGENYLTAAKIINCLFYSMTGIFIYQIARLRCGNLLSLLITGVSLLFPISTWTLLLLPGSLYMFGFWVLLWYVMVYWKDNCRFWFICGVGTGLLSLIKVHGIFLAPAFIILIAIHPRLHPIIVKSKLTKVSLYLISLFCIKLLAGVLFTGKLDFNLIGVSYSSFANDRLNALSLNTYLYYAAAMVFGHLMGLSLLFGIPLIIFTLTLMSKEVTKECKRLAKITIIMVVILVFVSSLFSALLRMESRENVSIQSRYYGFIYPSFFILCGYGLNESAFHYCNKLYRVFAAPTIITALYAATSQLRFYELIDIPHCPELAILFGHNFTKAIITGSILFSPLIFFALKNRILNAVRFYLFLIVPLIVVYSNIYFYFRINTYRHTETYILAIDAVQELTGGDVSRLAIYSRHYKPASIVAFFLDDEKIPIFYGFPDAGIIDANLENFDWGIICGNLKTKNEKFIEKVVDAQNKTTLFDIVCFKDLDFSTLIRPLNDLVWPVKRIFQMENGIAIHYGAPLPHEFSMSLELLCENGSIVPMEVELMDGQIIPVKAALHQEMDKVLVQTENLGRTIWIRRSDGGPMDLNLKLHLVPYNE